MAKQREVKQWITMNGKHVPIFEGESKVDAVKRALGKGGDKKETKDTSASKVKAAEDQKNTDSKEETVEDKKKAQKDKFFNDPYMQKAMKKAGVTREDWESGKVSDSQKYNISNDAYQMEDRAEKRAAKKAQSKKQEDGSNGKSEFGKETNDKISNYQDKFLKGKSDKQIQEIKDNLEKSGKLVGTSEQDHIALAAIRKEQEARKSGTQNQNAKQLGDTLREKGSVGIKDAKQYMDMDGSELHVNYRDWAGNTSAYMNNTGDKNGEGITVRAKNIDALEKHLKDNGYVREKGSSEYQYVYRKKNGQTDTQKQIAKDLDTKEKQIAQNKAEVDKLNGKGTKKSTTMSPAAKKLTRGVERAREQLNFDRPGDYAEISDRHWFSTLGVSNERMAEMMSVQDPKYDYEYQAETVPHKTLGKVTHHRMYRVPKEATKATTMADLKKQALAAGYSKEKIQGMTKAQLKKLLG